MPKTTSRSSEASVSVVPNPSNVVGFPLSEKKAKIIRDPYGNFRVVVRRYYWDSADQRGKEKRQYLGYVVDNVYYSTEDYRRHFHRDGTKRCAPKKPLSSKAKYKKIIRFISFRNPRLIFLPKLGYRNTESTRKFFMMSSCRRHLFLIHTYFYDIIKASLKFV